jgi:hypothetical protein
MGTLVQVLGKTGTGKSHAGKHLDPKTNFYFNCDQKNLPYKGWKAQYNKENKNYMRTSVIGDIYKVLRKISDEQPHIKTVMIDTINAIMSDKEMSERKKVGYDKWYDMAGVIYDLYKMVPNLRDDLTVFCMGHTEDYTGRDGLIHQRLLTNGVKLTKLNIEGCSTYTLYTKIVNDAGKMSYNFETHSDGYTTARSPEGAFESDLIPNDLNLVAEAIQAFEFGN